VTLTILYRELLNKQGLNRLKVMKHKESRKWVMGNVVYEGKARELGGVHSTIIFILMCSWGNM